MKVAYTRGMNIRKGPGTGYLVVDALDSGSTLSIVQRIKLDSEEWGRIGYNRWVAIKVGNMEYLKPISFSGSTKDHRIYEIVSEYGLNVRQGTGTEFPIVDHLPHGVMVNVMAKRKVAKNSWGMIGENQWVALKYDGQEMAKVNRGYRIG